MIPSVYSKCTLVAFQLKFSTRSALVESKVLMNLKVQALRNFYLRYHAKTTLVLMPYFLDIEKDYISQINYALVHIIILIIYLNNRKLTLIFNPY